MSSKKFRLAIEDLKGKGFESDRDRERKSFVIYSRFGKMQRTSNSYKYEEFAATTILEIIKAAISCVRTVIFFQGLRNHCDQRIVVIGFMLLQALFSLSTW